MAIKLVESPEPLTGASGQQTPLLIESESLRMLRQEMRRYCDQKVSGRSFLIAGHRGAGKTTMVQGSIQHTEDEIKSDWANLDLSSRRGVPPDVQPEGGGTIVLRPLFILLQGPNLLPADTPESTEPAASSAAGTNTPGAGSSTATSGDPPPNPMETVLIQITLGLYRALAGEFTRAYTEKAVNDARMNSRYGSEQAKRLSRRQLELALQFELELDQYPGVNRLYEFWRLARSLTNGILFWNAGDPRTDPGQGYRELVALSSSCQAYQRICGKLSRKDEKSLDDKTKKDSEVAIAAKGSELLKPLLALLAGGTVGAGLFAANLGTPLALFTGFATALLASVAVKYSSSRTREESLNRADLFIPDLSVATLDRVLPVLLNRIRRAGLAPVFVVDELDKVDLTARITEMVKRLKKLVAENAFFCFLTDRRYFEEMMGRTLDAPYPIEYTYFTNQLFIVFRHRDLHEYLDKVLDVQSASSPSTSGSSPDSSALAGDRDDKQVLQYILLHDSQMHPIDLRRNLAALRNANGDINIAPGEVRSPRRHYPFAIRIQLAIELILDEEEMRAEIEKRPAFLQLAHDAVYYISRKWVDAPLPLDLSDDNGKKSFAEYLRSRKATNTFLGPKPEQAGAAEDGTGTYLRRLASDSETEQERLEKLYLKVDTTTCDFLFRNLRKLATYLTASDDLSKAVLKAPHVSQVVVDALAREPLLVAIEGQPDKYRWTHNTAGRRLDEQTGAAVKPRPVEGATWAEHAEVISEFQHQLSELTQRQVDFTALASQFGLLKTSPAWTDARRALERLQTAEGSRAPYPEQEDDQRCMRDFRQILADGAPAVGMAVASALAIGGSSPNHAEFPVSWSLRIIAEALRFRNLSPERTLNALQHLVEQFTPHDDILNPPPVSGKDSVIVWSEWVRTAARDRFQRSEYDSFQQEAWRYWELRLREQVLMPEPPRLGTIVCHVIMSGPGAYLAFSVEEMAIATWTLIFASSFSQTQILSGKPTAGLTTGPWIPPWMAIAALQHLGFDQFALNFFLDRQREFDNTLRQGEFVQQGSSGASRRPAGILICRERCPSNYWRTMPNLPLVVCSFQTAQELITAFGSDGKKLRDALNISFVAFDFTRDAYAPSRDDTTESSEAASSSSSPKTLFLPPELSVYSFFAPDPNAPIPVLTDDRTRYPLLDERYTMTGVNDPAELFAAISGMLRRASPSVA